MKPRKKVGLVLGSGSARGWAHIGVIEALREENIPIDCIVGTSIGSFVGAIYAAGDLDSLKEFALQLNWKMILSYFDVVFPKSGFLDGKKVHDLFSMHTNVQTFEDLGIPVKMVATDLSTGERIILDSGNLIEAIRASISIPGVFTPVKQGERLLVDGGLVDPVPVDVAREMGAEIVIAVDLNTGLLYRRRQKTKKREIPKLSISTKLKRNEIIAQFIEHYENAEKRVKEKINRWLNSESLTPNILEIIGTSISIMEEHITQANLAIDPPDILIQPRLGDLKLFDFDQAERSIQEGYVRTAEKIDDIKTALISYK